MRIFIFYIPTLRDRITFIDRPPIDSVTTITSTQPIHDDEVKSYSIISVFGGGEVKKEDVLDVETGELENHTGL